MNQPDTPDSKKKQIISNLDIKSIFVKNIKDEIKKIFYNIDLTGNGVKGEGDFIKTITSYLRRSKAASQKAESAKQVKTQESAVIKQFAKDNNRWIEDFDETNYFDEIKSLLEANGFKNTKNQDFIHDELGIILEDLHDENVLKQEGKYFIIDAAIYLMKKSIFECI